MLHYIDKRGEIMIAKKRKKQTKRGLGHWLRRRGLRPVRIIEGRDRAVLIVEDDPEAQRDPAQPRALPRRLMSVIRL
jgi:hypothetical protein